MQYRERKNPENIDFMAEIHYFTIIKQECVRNNTETNTRMEERVKDFSNLSLRKFVSALYPQT